MTGLHAWLPPAILLTSLVPGLIIFYLGEERHALRTTLNLAGAIAKVILVAVMVWGVFHDRPYEWSLALLPGLVLTFRADAMAAMFASLSTVLWLVTTIYAVGYLEGSPHRSRFFGYFSLCVTRVDAKLQSYKERFESVVDAFLGDYESLRRSAMTYLGDLFNELDYPVNIRNKFSFG